MNDEKTSPASPSTVEDLRRIQRESGRAHVLGLACVVAHCEQVDANSIHSLFTGNAEIPSYLSHMSVEEIQANLDVLRKYGVIEEQGGAYSMPEDKRRLFRSHIHELKSCLDDHLLKSLKGTSVRPSYPL
jgi:hypothetical protein